MVTSKHVIVTLHALTLTLALACKEPGDAGPASESTASDETTSDETAQVPTTGAGGEASSTGEHDTTGAHDTTGRRRPRAVRRRPAQRHGHRRRERPGRLRPRLRVLRAPDFLSSKVFSGEMGTRAGADLACQIMAAEAGFEDEYKYRALLADASGSPNTFVDPDPDGLGRPFILPGGLIIAASYPALIKLGPGDGITTTEQGEMLSTRPATPISRTPPPPAPSGPPPIPSSRRASASTPPCPEIRRRSPSGGPRSTGSASRPTFVISPTACPGDGPGVVMP